MQNFSPEDLYLDLMKKTLSFNLWPEPPISINSFYRPPIKKFLVSIISKFLNKKNLDIVLLKKISEKKRIEGRVWGEYLSYADTMIGLKRLDNIRYGIETVLKENIPGDLIETGVWRGGACIFMRAVLAVYGITDRKVFVADSFKGLPNPNDNEYPADKGDRLHLHSALAISKQTVEDNFKKYGLLDDHVVFLEGWFKDTLLDAPIEKLSILRLDGDMYGSTIESLESLYPKLSKGGFCIIDDYSLKPCQKAVEDFRSKYSIDTEMKEIDLSSKYWRKDD